MGRGSDAAWIEGGERRNASARAARDRLCRLLGIEPGELRRIGEAEAEAVIAAILAGSRPPCEEL